MFQLPGFSLLGGYRGETAVASRLSRSLWGETVGRRSGAPE